jgi:Raf kinase inhibitor-like YbhB/YbcL family protein
MKALLAILLLAAAGAVAAPETSMQISSNDFSPGGTIPPRHTCEGSNTSPSLRFAYVPANTKSLVLIMDDPDAQKGTFTHWLVWNIPPDAIDFTTGTTPSGVVVGTNDEGKLGYTGPCPPSGQHRYYFRLFALDTTLTLPATARRAAVQAAIKGHILAEATILGRFGRSNATPTP